jgi:hypothetical protein
MSEEKNQEQVPSKEEYIAHMKEQIEITEYRVKLQELNAKLAMSRVEELQALMFIAQATTEPKNPPAPEEEEEEAPSKRKLKKD